MIHWAVITSFVEDFSMLPNVFLARVWRQANRPNGPAVGYKRLANAVAAGAFGVVATALMVVFLFGGSHMTLIGAAELVLAGAWLVYLLRVGQGGA